MIPEMEWKIKLFGHTPTTLLPYSCTPLANQSENLVNNIDTAVGHDIFMIRG